MIGTDRQSVVTLPVPMEHQATVLRDPARFKLLLCGRRWGKTASGLLAAVKGHGEYRGQWIGAGDGGNVFWIAPTYKQSTMIWRSLKRSLKHAWEDKNEQERDIFLPNGGRVGVRSADNPDSLRGEGLDGAILDEAAFMKPDTWYSVVRPMLADRNGWAFFPTTPNGFNWIKEEADQAHSRPQWSFWQRPTSDNPLIPASEIESARLELGHVQFAQEYLAQFIQQQGAEWGAECFNHLWTNDWPGAFELSALAIDPSKGRDQGDYAALVFVGLSGGLLWVDATIARMSAAAIAEAAVSMCREHQPHVVGMESNANQDIAFGTLCQQAAREAGVPPLPLIHYAQTENKHRRIFRLGPHMHNQRFRFRSSSQGCRVLESQLRGFPLNDVHDDGPDALEQAVNLLNQMASRGFTGQDTIEAF